MAPASTGVNLGGLTGSHDCPTTGKDRIPEVAIEHDVTSMVADSPKMDVKAREKATPRSTGIPNGERHPLDHGRARTLRNPLRAEQLAYHIVPSPTRSLRSQRSNAGATPLPPFNESLKMWSSTAVSEDGLLRACRSRACLRLPWVDEGD